MTLSDLAAFLGVVFRRGQYRPPLHRRFRVLSRQGARLVPDPSTRHPKWTNVNDQRSTKGDQTMRIPTLDIDNTARNEKPAAAPKLETVGQMLSAAGTIVMCLLALAFLAVLAWVFFA